MSIRWPEASEAKKSARKARGQYECAMCKGLFKDDQIHRDHRDPIIPVTGAPKQANGALDFNSWIERCFIYRTEYSILCVQCHKAKTEMEDQMRVFYGDKKREEKKKKLKKEK